MEKLRIVIPKGRIFENVVALLKESGISMAYDSRSYRPIASDPEIEVKIMKPQNIPALLELGRHDVGFTGLDWIVETQSNVTELLDLQLDPVKIVAAVPEFYDIAQLKKRKVIVASEYEYIAKQYLNTEGFNYVYLRTYGATEVFPPDDADMIIDNTATGKTLRDNQLKIIAEVMQSSTRFIANTAALSNPFKRAKIDKLLMLFRSILDARNRVMLEMNVAASNLEKIIAALPCMRVPTVSPLYAEQGYAVKAAVKKNEVSSLIPLLKELGATDILEYDFRKVVV
jgi:ATP phosphoribosyltransferase